MNNNQHVSFREEIYSLCGTIIKIGSEAPDFELISFDDGNSRWDVLTKDNFINSQYPILISITTTIDMPIGCIQTMTFNERAETFVENAVLINVTSDLPFAINRFKELNQITNLICCSDYKGNFGREWGLLIEDAMVLPRAVIVLDKNFVVQYMEAVEDLTKEPDYDSAFEALDKLLLEQESKT